MKSVLLLAAFLFVTACQFKNACAADDAEQKFTSSTALAARGRYALAIDLTKKEYVAALKLAQKDSMQAGQLEEANRIAKLLASPEASTEESLTSPRGKAAQFRYKLEVGRASKQYESELKTALSESMRASQLDEANRITAEIKKLQASTTSQPDSTMGYINLVPLIDPSKDTAVGTWKMEGGAITSSGKGEERIEIPYQPPDEYDFRISFTKMSGNNCVVQILSKAGAPFIWVMGTAGGDTFTFHYLKSGDAFRNKTTVRKPSGIKNNLRYTSVVKVRKDGVHAFVDDRLIGKWETDYSDITIAPFWSIRDHNILGLGSGDSKTVFHSVEVKEISGKGKRQR